MKKLLILLLIAPVLGFSQEVETPPEVLLCDEITKLVNLNYYREQNNSDSTASKKDARKFAEWFHSTESAIRKNGFLYGEKIGLRKVEGGEQIITWMSVMSKNCEAFKKMLKDLNIQYEANSEVFKYEDMEDED